MEVARLEFILKTKSIGLQLGVREREGQKLKFLRLTFGPASNAKGILCSGSHQGNGLSKVPLSASGHGISVNLHKLFGTNDFSAHGELPQLSIYID